MLFYKLGNETGERIINKYALIKRKDKKTAEKPLVHAFCEIFPGNGTTRAIILFYHDHELRLR